MRISTLALQQQALSAILEQQSALARTQLQIATGQRLLNPSDDPVAAQRVLELSAALERIDQFRTNSDVARVRLSVEENALASAGDVINRARELVVQAGNDTQSVETRGLIAIEVRQLADSLLNIANSQNGEGEYVFAGFRTETLPFAATGGVVGYDGDQGQRLLQIGDAQQIADGDPGSAVFAGIATGNGTFDVAATSTNTGSGVISVGTVTDPTLYDDGTYTVQFTTPVDYDVIDSGGGVVVSGTYTEGDSIAFQGISVKMTGVPDAGDTFTVAASSRVDVFEMLDRVASALEGASGDDAGRALVRNVLGSGLNNLDQALERFVEIRTGIGSRLNAIDSQQAANDELEIQFEATRSDLRDLDFAEAVSRLNLQLTGLQAAQQSFSRVQGLTLFNFL